MRGKAENVGRQASRETNKNRKKQVNKRMEKKKRHVMR